MKRILKLLAGCLCLLLVFIFLDKCVINPEPKSPPATAAGDSTTFDLLLDEANAKWSFLFANEHQLWLTDIHGQNISMLMDLHSLPGLTNAEFDGTGHISPNHRFILIRYTLDRDVNSQLLLLNMQDHSVQFIATEHQKYMALWKGDYGKSNPFWLSDDSFLILMSNNNSQTAGDREQDSLAYLIKHLDDLQAIHFSPFPTPHPVIEFHHSERTVRFASERDPSHWWRMDVIDSKGPRPGTEKESEYFRHAITRKRSPYPNKITLEIKRVVNSIEGWGDYYDKNHDRHWILLNQKIVRCSDTDIETKPIWHPDLKIFTWRERKFFGEKPPQVFLMDAQGQYRKWHDGEYWGKIPKAQVVTPQPSH